MVFLAETFSFLHSLGLLTSNKGSADNDQLELTNNNFYACISYGSRLVTENFTEMQSRHRREERISEYELPHWTDKDQRACKHWILAYWSNEKCIFLKINFLKLKSLGACGYKMVQCVQSHNALSGIK